MTIESLIVAILAITGTAAPHTSKNARVHAESAQAVATVDFPVEVLLGTAYVESRFYQTALSRLEDCTDPKDPKTCIRKTGVWASHVPPPTARPDWYCGPLQTGGWVTWAECQRMRTDVLYGYQQGVRELTKWWNDPSCSRLPDDDRLRCTLAGHNAGYAGAANYKVSPYVRDVFKARDRIVKITEHEELKPGS
jgi:hypothetical protein